MISTALLAALSLSLSQADAGTTFEGDRKPETWAELRPVAQPVFDLERASSLYEQSCRICHGAKGDGEGAVARFLDPRPRDFTRGVYKFRSTPSGSLPTDQDLFNTLTRGLPGTAMLSWSGLSVDDRWQLVQYVKRLSTRFQSEPPTEVLAVPIAPPSTPERIARGQAVWVKLQCGTCHGEDGRGWGPAAKTSKDDQGRPSYPFNLTRSGNFRIGRASEDLYRTLFTGLDGTAMPSYSGSLSEDEAWDLVHFVRSLFADVRN